MTNLRSLNPSIAVLGGTGKTGRRVAARLGAAGGTVRTAARHHADARFDWDDVASYESALDRADAVYLVTQSLRPGNAHEVAALLDRAEIAGIRHVTLLSARGVDEAPAEVTARAIELELISRDTLTHSILRPNWFMQDFSESFFQPSIAADGVILAPTGDSTEAFVSADDIAEVAVTTLLYPEGHAGAQYTLSGAEALSFAQVADRIAAATGRTIKHVDLPVEEWVAKNLAGGMAKDYAQLHVMLFEAINAGNGSSISQDVERVTGHPSRYFDEYAMQAATLASWTRAAA